jgi:UDPglucose 6-dehydrogenase
MIEVACNDSRIGHSHSKVPGHDGSRGFGGTCFPKDIANLLNLIEKQGLKSYVLKSVVNRNREQDRPEKDWENNLGRSVVENE